MSTRSYVVSRDEGIRRLTKLGLSQSLIAKKYNCSTATISMRLKHMGMESHDTRKSFMDSVFLKLPLSVREYLGERTIGEDDIEDVIVESLIDSYERFIKDE